MNDYSHDVIGAAIQVHRVLGPGLLESAYEMCLCEELGDRDIPFVQQMPLAIEYKSKRLDCGYRLDLVVGERLIVELKSVERILPIHEAQILTYMRLSKISLGLLINFNVRFLKQGIHRFIL